MRAQDIIKKKRDGGKLSDEELRFFISGLVEGAIPDYQSSALLMAIFLQGMDDEETVSLTSAMMDSGGALGLEGVAGPLVDKHSTGGVGDKPSIILAPLMATMGIKVPMVSGRGLGHTGGTLDKLESIPGLRTDLGQDELREHLKNPGFFMIGQTEGLAPADKKLYALRDVTATVESVPLIASSIMSKKLAEGVQGLLLDVKMGSGAFMKEPEMAMRLARTMVDIGNSMGVKTAALITDMNQPLGRTVGNALELKECISVLKGRGRGDLMELTMILAAWMLNIADAISDETEVKKMNKFTLGKYQREAIEFIEKGDAFKKFVEFIDAQHGDPEIAFTPTMLPSASSTKHITAEREGFVRKMDAECVGTAAMMLGAGRARAEDTIDHAAGIILNKKVGDYVKAGEPVAQFHYNNDGPIKDAEYAFRSGLEIGLRETATSPLVLGIVM
jgi:pyrimidine-nucleoside phosphorylase